MKKRRQQTSRRAIVWDGARWIDGTGAAVDPGARGGAFLVAGPHDIARLAQATAPRQAAIYTSGAGEPVYLDARPCTARSVHRLFETKTLREAGLLWGDDPDAVARAIEAGYALASAVWAECAGVREAGSVSQALARPLRAYARPHGHHTRCLDTVYPGRVELATHGVDQPVRVLDIRSAYGWAGLAPLPGAPVGKGPSVPDSALRDGLALVTAEVDIPVCRWGPLPVRDTSGHVHYPYGRWIGTWAASEILPLLESGRAKVLTATWYTPWSPYAAVIEKAYGVKATTRCPIRKAAAKTLIVSTYGMLAAPSTSEVLIVRPRKIQDDDEPCEGGIAVRRTVFRPVWGWSPAAAEVTARVRARLLEAIARVPGVTYLATDSIHALDSEAAAALDQGSRDIGTWATEGVWPSGRWHAPGTYLLGPDALRGRARAGGVPTELRASYLTTGDAVIEAEVPRPTGGTARIAYRTTRRDTMGLRTPDPYAPGWTEAPHIDAVWQGLFRDEKGRRE